MAEEKTHQVGSWSVKLQTFVIKANIKKFLDWFDQKEKSYS